MYPAFRQPIQPGACCATPPGQQWRPAWISKPPATRSMRALCKSMAHQQAITPARGSFAAT